MKFIGMTAGRQLLLGGTGLLTGAALGCASPAVDGDGPAIEFTVQALEVDRAVVDALGPNGQVRI